jgi:hypothetical protein
MVAAQGMADRGLTGLVGRVGLSMLCDEPSPAGVRDSGGPIGGAELGEDAIDVGFYGGRLDVEPPPRWRSCQARTRAEQAP